MNELTFRSPEERAQFSERLAAGRDDQVAQDKRRRQNEGFKQVYRKGFTRMRALLTETKSQVPMLLYLFLAENTDSVGGVLVADQETICQAIGCSRTSLWRAIKYLEERNALLRLSVGGSVHAYALDPTEIWSGYADSKDRAVFRSRTMVRKSAQSNDVNMRMQVMVKERAREPELPFDDVPLSDPSAFTQAEASTRDDDYGFPEGNDV